MEDDKMDIQESTRELLVFEDQNKGNKQSHASGNFLAAFSSRWLDAADTVIYAIVGTSFLVGAICALGYSFWYFGSQIIQVLTLAAKAGSNDAIIATAIAAAIIQFISDLLLVVIIMEVLGTVLHYLKAHTTSLRPFLFIGIVSATRSILSIGARLSIAGNNIKTYEFMNDMIELGVSAAVVLALGITIKLLGKQLDDAS